MGALSALDAPEVIVDRCPSCDGFWLDKGELDQMKWLVSKEDEKIEEGMTYLHKPQDCSWLRWALQSLRTTYFKQTS